METVLTGRIDGRVLAQQKLERVRAAAAAWQEQHRRPLTLQSIFPFEDVASVTYTKLKQQDAHGVGLEYVTEPKSLRDPRDLWLRAIQQACQNPKVDGVLIQKPSWSVFDRITEGEQDFTTWWDALVESLDPTKDVDGLSPINLLRLQRASQKVVSGEHSAEESLDNWILAATAQAVIDIALVAAGGVENLRRAKVAMVGRSVIVGQPAAYGLRLLGVETQLIGRDTDLSQALPQADIIIAATGKSHLIEPHWVKEGSMLIDVGAPTPEFHPDCLLRAAAWTPVPYGVGPVTRACLLENVLKLSNIL